MPMAVSVELGAGRIGAGEIGAGRIGWAFGVAQDFSQGCHLICGRKLLPWQGKLLGPFACPMLYGQTVVTLHQSFDDGRVGSASAKPSIRAEESPVLVGNGMASSVNAVGWAYVRDDGHAANKLHREEPRTAVGQELVERDEVWVGHIGQSPEFAFEAIECGSFAITKQLQRDLGGSVAIEGFVDNPKATLTQPPNEFEALCAREIK